MEPDMSNPATEDRNPRPDFSKSYDPTDVFQQAAAPAGAAPTGEAGPPVLSVDRDNLYEAIGLIVSTQSTWDDIEPGPSGWPAQAQLNACVDLLENMVEALDAAGQLYLLGITPE